MAVSFTPKKVYESYLNYYWQTVVRSSFLTKGLLISAGLAIVLFVIRSGGSYLTGRGSFLNSEESFFALQVFGGLLVVICLLSLVVSSVMWRQCFEIGDGKIVDHFPTHKVFDMKDIEKVVLMSKGLAHIFIKPQHDSLYTICYWHGASENEWKDFLSILVSESPSVVDKVFVAERKWNGPTFKKSSIACSYTDLGNNLDRNSASSSEDSVEARHSHWGRTIERVLTILSVAIILNITLRFLKDFGSGTDFAPAFYFVSTVGGIVCVGIVFYLKKKRY